MLIGIQAMMNKHKIDHIGLVKKGKFVFSLDPAFLKAIAITYI